MRRKLAAGNWKMNGLQENLHEIKLLADTAKVSSCEVIICPPATLLRDMNDISDHITVGGQTCHSNASGAHTGDISAQMIADSGATYVILGHSERRSDHGETDADVHATTKAAWDAGLSAIVCIGESLTEREAIETLDVISAQLSASIPDEATGKNLVIAYEPIWAIGTGLTPTLDQIAEVHDFIRTYLKNRFGNAIGDSIRIIYGGSLNAKNAADIAAVSNVDGGLVGGASQKAADPSKVIKALG